MSLSRIRYQRKRWRLKWPWNRLFPLRVDERFCRHCGFPYHEGPLPNEVKRYCSDNVVALALPAGSWRKGDLTITVGRWRASGKQLFCSAYIPITENDNLLAGVEMARED